MSASALQRPDNSGQRLAFHLCSPDGFPTRGRLFLTFSQKVPLTHNPPRVQNDPSPWHCACSQPLSRPPVDPRLPPPGSGPAVCSTRAALASPGGLRFVRAASFVSCPCCGLRGSPQGVRVRMDMGARTPELDGPGGKPLSTVQALPSWPAYLTSYSSALHL